MHLQADKASLTIRDLYFVVIVTSVMLINYFNVYVYLYLKSYEMTTESYSLRILTFPTNIVLDFQTSK